MSSISSSAELESFQMRDNGFAVPFLRPSAWLRLQEARAPCHGGDLPVLLGPEITKWEALAVPRSEPGLEMATPLETK